MNIKELMTETYSLFQLVEKVHASCVKHFENGKSCQGALTIEQLSDLAFMCKKISALFDNSRKFVNTQEELFTSLACLRWAMSADMVNPQPIRGCLATGSPDMKLGAMLPAKGTPEYAQCLSFMGVEDNAGGCIALDWKAVSEWISEETRLGRTVPKYFGGTFEKSSIRHLTRKGVDLSDPETVEFF